MNRESDTYRWSCQVNVVFYLLYCSPTRFTDILIGQVFDFTPNGVQHQLKNESLINVARIFLVFTRHSSMNYTTQHILCERKRGISQKGVADFNGKVVDGNVLAAGTTRVSLPCPR